MISSLKQHLKTGSHEQKPKMSYSSPLCLTNRKTNELCEIIEKNCTIALQNQLWANLLLKCSNICLKGTMQTLV